MFIAASAFIYLGASLLTFLSNPNRSYITTYDGQHLTHAIFIFAGNLILGNLIELLPGWLEYFLPIVKILLTLFLIYEVFSIPFIHFYSNVVAISFYVMSIFSDFLVFFDHISPYLRLFLPLGAFFLSGLLFALVFHWLRNSILKIVNDERISMNSEFLNNYLYPKSKLQAYQYLRIGFYYKALNILNGKVSFHLAEQVDDIDFWICVTSIISFFAGERANFSYCLSKFKTLYPTKFLQKMRILHLIKLEQYRYLTRTNEISHRLASLNIQTQNAIALTKKFWLDVSNHEKKLALSTINTISDAIVDAQSSWKQTLNMFPNEYRFAMDYSTFLVECKGLFNKGMIYLIKAGHLEKGIQGSIDELFRAFVCSLPSFLYDRAVDKRGNVTNQQAFGVTITHVKDNTDYDKLEEDIENGMIETLMRERYEWPILRGHLSRATSNYRIPYLASFNALKFLSFLVVLVLIILMNIFFSTEFNSFNDVYNLVDSYNNMRISIAYLYSSFLLQWGNMSGTIDFPNFNLTMHEVLPTIDFNDLNASFLFWFNEAQLTYMSFFNNLLKLASTGQSIAQLAENIIEKNIKMSTCTFHSSDNIAIDTYENDFKSAITLILYTANSLLYGNITDDANRPKTCKMLLLFPELQKVFNSISFRYATLAIEINEKVHRIFSIIFYVFLGFSILVLVPLIIIPQFLLQKESQRILTALKSVSKNAALTASKLMLLTNEEPYDIESHITQQYMYENSWFILSYRLAYASIALIILIFSIISYVFTSHTCNRYTEYILIYHYGSIRHGETSELLAIVVLKAVSSNASFPYFSDEYIRDRFTQSSNQLFEDSNKFIHGDNSNGISKYSDKITNLQVKDKCEILSSASSYYHCMSFQRAISLYVILGQNVMRTQFDESFRLNKLVDFLHIGTCEIDSMNQESRSLMLDLMKSNVSASKSLSVTLLTISIFLLLGLLLLDALIYIKMKYVLKTALLLIRHIPPPDIIESAELLNILLVLEKKEYHKRNNVYEVIFNTISSPIILVGDNGIIKMANKSFESVFQLRSEQMVGSNLTSFIPPPLADQNDLSIEEQGTFLLYEKLRQIQNNELKEETFSVITRCVSSFKTNHSINDKSEEERHLPIPVNLTVFTVRAQNQVIGFIFIIEDQARESKIQEQLREANRNVDVLMSQLIPREIASYIDSRLNSLDNDLSFSIPESFLVVVRIKNIDQYLKQNWDDFNNLIENLEFDAKENPPFIFIQTTYDLALFIGGIFGDIEMTELSSLTLSFVNVLTKTLDNKLQSKKNYSIAIAAGGPLVAGVITSFLPAPSSIDPCYYWAFSKPPNNNSKNGSFLQQTFESFHLETNGPRLPSLNMIGDLLRDAIQLTQFELSEPIITNASTFEYYRLNDSINYSRGPNYQDNPTYIISFKS